MNIVKKTLVRPSLTSADVTTIKTTFELLEKIAADSNPEDVIMGYDEEVCKVFDLVQILESLKDICTKLYIEDK